jgi:glutathione synthase/RimK-type ligase-like ATP-grasp enzyme
VSTKEIPNLKLSDFPAEHLIQKDTYYVQQFLKTGKSATFYRALVYLGDILLSYKVEQNNHYPDYKVGLDILLKTSVASNLQGSRKINLVDDDDVRALAIKVALAFPDLPLLGVDIIPDAVTGKLYVLEINAGGNTWAFTAKPSQDLRSILGLKNMILQYNAWDRAAEALVRKTHELAK